MSNQSFTEIERQAQVAEKLREQQAADAKKQAEESMCVITVVPLACVGWWQVAWVAASDCSFSPGLPLCVWPTRSSRLIARRKKKNYRTLKERNESRLKGWAWAWCPEGEVQALVCQRNAFLSLGARTGPTQQVSVPCLVLLS